MSFLNPALLVGLLAASIPILIHLFSRRRFPIIDFSTLKFLKRLQRQQMRRLKLRQWLLLLLRTLAILLITLAFARPTLKGSVGEGLLTTSKVSMGIIIDGSASMQTKTPSGSCFDQAKSAVGSLVSMMNPGDRAYLVLARDNPVVLTPSPDDRPEFLSRMLQDAEVWDGGANLGSALDVTQRELGKTEDFRREIYVFSDFNKPTELPSPPPKTDLFFIDCGSKSHSNLAVTEAKVVSDVIEPGQPVDVEIKITNFDPKPREDIYYSIFLNGSRVAEDLVSIAAGSEIIKTYSITPQKPGLQQGSVEIEGHDDLAVDNKAYFCFAVPQQLSVLLVADPEDGREIRLALTPQPDSTELFKVQTVGFHDWEGQTLSQFDVIIFNNPRSFSGSAGVRLSHWVENGGGLLIFPGSKTDVGSVNRDLLEKMGKIRWGEKLGQSGQNQVFISWSNPELNTPLLRGMFKEGNQPSSPQIYQLLNIVGGDKSSGITCSNGMPFIDGETFGQGRIEMGATSPLPDWSDWGTRGIFAPLIHRLTLSLAKKSQSSCYSIHAGNDIQIPLSPTAGENAVIKDPIGQETKLAPQTVGQKQYFVYNALNPTGTFELRSNLAEYLISANVPLAESDIIPQDVDAKFPSWKAAGVHVIPWSELQQKVKSSRFGQELWKAALAFGLILLFIELFLGRGQRSEEIVESPKCQPEGLVSS